MEAQANERRYAFLCGSCNKTHFAPYGLVLQNCPACGSTDLRFESKRASAQEIDGVIPFFITTEELPKLIRGYLGNALVRPALFKHSMQVTKRFVPFWVFDEKASGVLMLKGADFDYDVRHNYETDYTAYCSGSFHVQHLLVDASEDMEDEWMDELEPFDFSLTVESIPDADKDAEVVPVTTSMDECIQRAKRMTVKAAARDIAANLEFDTVDPMDEHTELTFSNMMASMILLPVYTVEVRVGARKRTFTVNGQTGEVIGPRVFSVWKRIVGYLIMLGLPAFAFVSHIYPELVNDGSDALFAGYSLLLILIEIIPFLIARLVFGVSKAGAKLPGIYAPHVPPEDIRLMHVSHKKVARKSVSIFKGKSIPRAFGQLFMMWLRAIAVVLCFVIKVGLFAAIEVITGAVNPSDDDSSGSSSSDSSSSGRSSSRSSGRSSSGSSGRSSSGFGGASGGGGRSGGGGAGLRR